MSDDKDAVLDTSIFPKLASCPGTEIFEFLDSEIPMAATTVTHFVNTVVYQESKKLSVTRIYCHVKESILQGEGILIISMKG